MCASAALAPHAAADDGAPFITQLQLPARGLARDVFAWRGEQGVAVEAGMLRSLGIAAPDTDQPVPLSSIEGLSYQEDRGASAIVVTCTAACYEAQHVDLYGADGESPVDAGAGGYLNYDLNLQWTDEDALGLDGLAEAALFGRWGLITSSWLAEANREHERVTRLETSWTIDRPRERVRIRFGDSAAPMASGVPLRFAGVQIGRHFGLAPSLITYPVPLLNGEAESASTVALYVDGVLRGRSDVAAGPFIIEQAPVITGAGQAELVVTDILGREQTIVRPFFVSTSLLRRGLSDWSVAAGAERRGFGRDSASYGDSFATAHYRYGLTDALTLEAAVDASEESSTVRAGAAFVLTPLGEGHLSHARNETGGATSASLLYDARFWSFGLQFDSRDDGFVALGRRADDGFRRGVAGNLSVNLGDQGALTLTGAGVDYADKSDARTFTLSYTPDLGDGALSFRFLHTHRDRDELSAGVSLSLSLGGDAAGHFSVDSDARGVTYRAGAQRAPTYDRVGWRTRASAGAVERIDVAALLRGRLGDSMAQYARVENRDGVRLRHAGSVGWIDGLGFAGRRIEGAFALVDAGAPGVAVTRQRMEVGETGRDGRMLATNLQPYAETTIGIAANDLPLDRALVSPIREVTPAEGAGVVVRFSETQQRLAEARVRFDDGRVPARGAVLVRDRDGRRFPIASEGRIVLQGAMADDVLHLEGAPECTTGVSEATDNVLVLQCAAAA